MSPPLSLQGDSWGLAGQSCSSGSAQLMGAHGQRTSSTALEKEPGGFLRWLMAPGLCQGLLGSSAVAAQHHLCSSLWYWPLPCSHC